MRHIFLVDRVRRFVRTALRVVVSGYELIWFILGFGYEWLWVVLGGYGRFWVVMGGYGVVMDGYMALRVFFGGCGLLLGCNGW